MRRQAVGLWALLQAAACLASDVVTLEGDHVKPLPSIDEGSLHEDLNVMSGLYEDPKRSDLGETGMTTEGLAVLKQRFSETVAKVKEPKLKDALELADMDMAEATGEATEAQKNSLDELYIRFDAVAEGIRQDSALEVTFYGLQMGECDKNMADTHTAITTATTQRSQNEILIREDAAQLEQNRQDFQTSKQNVAALHVEFTEIPQQRINEREPKMVAIDETTKALDVLREAIYVVCEKFPRFKTTKQCRHIKSQPDVDEPDPIDMPTADTLENDKMETGFYEKAQQRKWEKVFTNDERKVGVVNPGGGPDKPTDAEKMDGGTGVVARGDSRVESTTAEPEQERADDRLGESNEQSKAVIPGVPQELVDAMMKADHAERRAHHQHARHYSYVKHLHHLGQHDKLQHKHSDLSESAEMEATLDEQLGTVEHPRKLGESEEVEVEKLSKMADELHDERVSAPMRELTVALGEGVGRKALNLVDLLINVEIVIYAEQTKVRTDLIDTLHAFYTKAWELQEQLNIEQTEQDRLAADTETRRVRIHMTMEDNEHQRQTILEQTEIYQTEESRCLKITENHDETQAIHGEDLENLMKLKSLIRSLYERVEPGSTETAVLGCPTGFRLPSVRCSGEAHGWCIFTSRDTNQTTCSCNYGYHGSACEYIMCPGNAHAMYQWDENGACSGHGHCNKLSGECEDCTPEENPFVKAYFHGRKSACDDQNCPNFDAEGISYEPDNLCNGHGTCDTLRGICNCENEWSGKSCELMKCPNQNGILYHMESGNACDGHGACDKHTGTCICPAPYSGATCERKDCLANCMGRGTCNEMNGKCACEQPFYGPQCEFQDCPENCRTGGWCDHLTGDCLCHYGAGGESCRTATTQCSAPTAKTDEANWYRLWDSDGWAMCPPNQALYGLYREDCEALACVESAKCSGLCLEGQDGQIDGAEPGAGLEVKHCYHSIKWYDSFDAEGWSLCDPNYFIMGLYKDCESLYCLSMAKCCAFKNARWADCGAMDFGGAFLSKGWIEAPAGKWMVGFHRQAAHKLRNLDNVKACTFAWNF